MPQSLRGSVKQSPEREPDEQEGTTHAPPNRRTVDRIVTDIDADRIRNITENALEGLAKKELNLSAIVGKSAEARERRLVPEVIEQFTERLREEGPPRTITWQKTDGTKLTAVRIT